MCRKQLKLPQKLKAFLIYLFFGVFTTAANYAVYLPLYNTQNLSAVLSNAIAWLFSVLVAFLTNKPFVFHSHNWSLGVVVPEFLKFVSCRLLSGVAESLILLIAVDLLNYDGNIWKIITSIFVVIFNYFGSKCFVFHNPKK